MAMVYNIPKCLEYTLKSNTIRTDHDLQVHNWTSIFKKNQLASSEFGTNDQSDILKYKPDEAESGAYEGELHLKPINYLL